MPTLTLGLDYVGGPVIEVYVGVPAAAQAALFAGQSPPRPLKLRALVDTGATLTVVDASALAKLPLDEIGAMSFHSATTGALPVVAKLYAVSLASAETVTGVLADDLAVAAGEDFGGLGVEVLLGRDILGSCIFLYDGPGRTMSLTFQPFEQPSP